MSKKYINEAVSLNGKIAFNENNVSFKTNDVDGILQHLAWQYGDTFLGTVKKFKFEETTGFIANTILNLSSNGSPMIFSELSENKVSFDIEAGETVTILHLNYMFMDNADLMQYVDDRQVEFIVLIVNGIWVIANKVDNAIFFENFSASGGGYVSTQLPTAKIPKVISEIDSVGLAKSALKAYAKEQGLTKYAISSFTPTDDIEILANPSMSKFSSFMPDLREFMRNEVNVTINANQEVPYLVDEDNGRLLFINLGSVWGNNKWHLIQDKSYINFITNGGQNFFVDSVKNAVISSQLNQGVKIKEIYDLITRQRAVAIANSIQPKFDKHGYFIAYDYSKTISPDKFNKVSVDTKGNVTKIINTKPLVIYRDTIVLFSINLETNVVVLSFPKEPETLYITVLDEITELYNEFYQYDAYYDTVLSINDAYFLAQK